MSTTGNNAERNESGSRLRLIGAACLIVYICTLNSLCTQFTAYRMAYYPTLGAPLSMHVCSSFAWWDWMFRFYDYTPGSYNYALIFSVLGTLVGMLAYVLWVSFKSHNSRKHDDVHGTAYSATREEVQETGLLPREGKTGQGVYYGAYDDAEIGKTFYLRRDDPEHALTPTPTCSGKDVGLVTPTLLSWPHSVLVLGCEGENYTMASGWQQKHTNSVVLCFDPTKPGIGCAWSPLGEIRHRIRFQVSDVQNIAIMAMDSDGKDIKSGYLHSAALELLAGLILHTPYKGDQIDHTPCLQDTGHMLTGTGDFAAPDTTNDLTDGLDGNSKVLAGLLDEIYEVYINDSDPTNRGVQIVITGAGTRIANIPACGLGSIISTASNAPALYRDSVVGENMSRSGFRIVDLMDRDRPVSFYLISTPKISKRFAPLTRLLLTMIMLTMADEMESDDNRAKAAHKRRLLLILSGFPTPSKIEVFEGALAYAAGYGVKAYIIMQDVSQFYKACTREESIISSCHVRVVYAPSKLETAERMSKMTGNTVVAKEQVITSGKRFGVVLDNMSRSYREAKRPLMEPDEIMRLPGPVKDASGERVVEVGEMLIFVVGYSVIRGHQILCSAGPAFLKRSKPKPMPTGVVRKVPGQPVVTALAPEDRATNQRESSVASWLDVASESPPRTWPG